MVEGTVVHADRSGTESVIQIGAIVVITIRSNISERDIAAGKNMQAGPTIIPIEGAGIHHNVAQGNQISTIYAIIGCSYVGKGNVFIGVSYEAVSAITGGGVTEDAVRNADDVVRVGNKIVSQKGTTIIIAIRRDAVEDDTAIGISFQPSRI